LIIRVYNIVNIVLHSIISFTGFSSITSLLVG